jgi:hypothetical protein
MYTRYKMNLEGKDDDRTSLRCILGKWSDGDIQKKGLIACLDIRGHELWTPLPWDRNYFSELGSKLCLTYAQKYMSSSRGSLYLLFSFNQTLNDETNFIGTLNYHILQKFVLKSFHAYRLMDAVNLTGILKDCKYAQKCTNDFLSCAVKLASCTEILP